MDSFYFKWAWLYQNKNNKLSNETQEAFNGLLVPQTKVLCALAPHWRAGSQGRGDEKNMSQRMGKCSPKDDTDTAFPLMNSLELWLSAQDGHKIGFLISFGMGGSEVPPWGNTSISQKEGCCLISGIAIDNCPCSSKLAQTHAQARASN